MSQTHRKHLYPNVFHKDTYCSWNFVFFTDICLQFWPNQEFEQNNNETWNYKFILMLTWWKHIWKLIYKYGYIINVFEILYGAEKQCRIRYNGACRSRGLLPSFNLRFHRIYEPYRSSRQYFYFSFQTAECEIAFKINIRTPNEIRPLDVVL